MTLKEWCIENNNTDLINQWDQKKNTLNPSEITFGSNKKVWWIGKCGHSWEASVNNRTQGRGCPYCAGKRVLEGFNDLETLSPQIAAQWHPNKNGELKPSNVTNRSNKTVWWLGECGHEWQSSINDRTTNNSGSCPYCSNRKLLTGFNDLETVYPIIAKEWNYKRNSIKPSEIVYGCAKSVWWKCFRCGHEWKQTPAIRTRLLTGCKKCKNDSQISRAEKSIAYYLSKAGIDFEENYILSENYSVDIYIPSRKIGIEYDGQQWHKKPDRDLKKNQICKKLNISLYRIREPELDDLNDYSHDIKIDELSYDMSYMNKTIKTLFELLDIQYDDIDVKRDGIEILSYMRLYEKKNSLFETDKELAKEWDYKKNKDLNPSYFTRGSDASVWWVCANNHEYKATISARTRGRGCPYCTGRIIMQGFNDLSTKNPKLALEWNSDKNEKKPTEVTVSSSYNAWWRCKQGHEWQETVNSRNTKNSSCPYCAGKRVWVGFNDLATTHPDLAKEWDYTKNSFTPQEVVAGSNTKVWWKCSKCNYVWKTSVVGRKSGHGCPRCGTEKLISNRHRNRIKANGSFADNYPQLAAEWDYDRNKLNPNEVENSSNKKVWWICSKGHNYESTINNRTSGGKGCPFCSNSKVLKGFNDLGTLYPALAGEWDYENNTLSPDQVLPGCNKKANWICKYGHKWSAIINSRTRGNGCPYCAGQKVLKGFNDLGTLSPQIAKEWNYEKNIGLTPEMFAKVSNKKVWWKCKLGHEWETTIGNRTRQNTGCPYCGGKKTIKGVNDLETAFPSLALEWDYEENGNLTPDALVPGSGKRVYWKCPHCNHKWTTSIQNRTTRKSGCPKCKYNWYNDNRD